MADVRKSIECDYCDAEFHIKYNDELNTPEFCCFCGEVFDDPREVEDDDGDLDYTDEEKDGVEY